MRLRKGTRVKWKQYTPGRGVESLSVERSGVLEWVHKDGSIANVRPDDMPGVLILMGTKGLKADHPAAPSRHRDASREKAKYRRNM